MFRISPTLLALLQPPPGPPFLPRGIGRACDPSWKGVPRMWLGGGKQGWGLLCSVREEGVLLGGGYRWG
jgi:hypothetical protein